MYLFPSTQIVRLLICRPTAYGTANLSQSYFEIFLKVIVRLFGITVLFVRRIVHGRGSAVFGQIEIRTNAGQGKYDNIVFTE